MEFEEIYQKHPTEFTTKLLEHKDIFYEIYEACGHTFWEGCGSYLFDGKTYKYCELMYEKQELLFNQVKTANSVLEIGTYMGHSLLIMLLSNPTLKITCIDISDTYTLPAITILNKHFNNAITFIHSDSLSALKELDASKKTFDFFHIDGHHENDYITNEFIMVKKLNNRVDNLLRVMFDDQDSLLKLQTEINKYFNVIRKTIPNCAWNNLYYEIQL
jgi:hypothetical protein